MILDSSAVVAIVTEEIDAERFARLASTSRCQMSVATWLECQVVGDRRWPADVPILEALLDDLELELTPVDVPQARVARAAHRRYGAGSGSPARLNFGDCFAYALAITTGEPLLFKGEDFTHTDVLPAI